MKIQKCLYKEKELHWVPKLGNLSVIKWKTMNNTSQPDKQQNKVVWQAIEHNMMNSEVKHGECPNVTWKQQ